MKWRCEWCGKPHEEDDPPCDNCGHGSFEKAIVPEPDYETVDTGPAYVWKCPNCGREHVKNTPPCSRCGEPELEKTEQTYEDVASDLETPSWFDVAKPYLPVFVLIGLVVFLFASGIVSPSIIPGIGTPTPPDAPGESAEAAGLDLEAVEDEIHEGLEAERANEGYESRTSDGGLAALAEYLNRQVVIAEYTDDDPGGPPQVSEFGVSCGGESVVTTQLTHAESIDAYDDETTLAAAITEELFTSEEVRTGYGSEGIDVHVVDDDVVVFYTAC